MLNWDLAYSDMRQQQSPLLTKQISRLQRDSPFYQACWGDQDRPSFESLPLITKHDLHEALGSGLLGINISVREEQIFHIHMSSGTSGRPTNFGLTRADYNAWMKIFIRGFTIAGIRPHDRVLHAFAMSRGYAGAVPMVDALYRMGCVALPIGAEAGSARLIDAIDHLSPRVLYASPSMARHIAERYEADTGRNPSESSIQLLVTGGEPGAGDLRSKSVLSEAWGAEVREVGGGTDVCPMMVAECAEHDGLHFIAGDEVAIEVIDLDTSERVDLSSPAEGEIVYSHLRRRANPVMRMRHGDLVSTQPEPCDCGIKALRIRFIGRSDDMVIVRGVKVFPSSLQEIVSQFVPRLTGRFIIRRPVEVKADDALTVLCEAIQATPDLRLDFELRAREVLGVRVNCELVAAGSLVFEHEQKGRWVENV